MQREVSPVIGIDLGTSNTVAAATSDSGVTVVPLRQYTAPHQTEQRTLLPSCLYLPLPEEAFSSLGQPPTSWIVGEHARRRAAEVPDRVVTSAKSWLCHSGVDREAEILPWIAGRDEGEAHDAVKLSPLQASSLILRQVRIGLQQVNEGWDARHAVLTVPASFDQVARKLTLEAAQQAGIAVSLLEEPQAAFYDWLHRAPVEEIEALCKDERPKVVLVVDVGGGTTDLTLLRVTPRPLAVDSSSSASLNDRLAVERIAVGRHLLLGGDNVDLALAHAMERKMLQGKRLGPSDFAQLIAACKGAKEVLLSPQAPPAVPIRLARRGSALVGNTLSVELTREEVETLVLDGFLPEVSLDTPIKHAASGLLSFGLPFERDAAITRHICQFLRQHANESGAAEPNQSASVDAVLFNGGLFKSDIVARRVASVLSQWAGKSVQVLAGPEPDYAVARGAVWYGLSLRGEGLRITGGSSHGYYIGVHTPSGAQRAVCVVPKGAHEEETFTVNEPPLELTLGTPVRFELFASSVLRHQAGNVIDPLEETHALQRLPPVSTLLTPQDGDQDKEAQQTGQIPVRLQGALTAVGTLDLACQETGSAARRFGLAFELRPQELKGKPQTTLAPPAAAPAPTKRSTVNNAAFAEATEVLVRVFGKGRKDVKAREVKDVWRELERLLGPRRDWDLALNRALFDVLMPLAQGRRRSADHERVFYSLAGYSLRPGFGHALDPDRVRLLEPLFEPGLAFHTERLSWEQFYIAWRRVASGVSEQTQGRMRELCDPFVAPSELKLKKPKAFKAIELPALWDLLSWLERVTPEKRALFGQWILERTWTSRNPKHWEWLGRVGAREPTYASAHHVVRPRHAEAWLEHLLSEAWEEAPTAPLSALRMARCTGDRARDVNETLRERVATRLELVAASPQWAQAVRQHVPIERGSDVEVYGEDLPVGLRMLD